MRSFGFALLLWVATSAIGWAQTPLVEMTATQAKQAYGNMVLFIAAYSETGTAGNTAAGTARACEETGTGFIISSEGYVVTSKHILRDKVGDRYSNLKVVGRVGMPFDCTFPVGDGVYELEVIEELGVQDAALLRMKSTTSFNWVPACRENIVADGSRLLIMGFPLGRDLSVRTASLENKSGPRGLWQFDAALNSGNSGGPVFNNSGQLIGLVYGDTATGNDLSFFVPFQYFSTLYQLAQAPLVDCAVFDIGLCDPLEVPYPVAYTLNDHTDLKPTWRDYQESFVAQEGKIIIGAEWCPSSINNTTSPIVDVKDDKRTVVFTASMESGPLFNQYRAWVRGLIITRQVDEQCARVQNIN